MMTDPEPAESGVERLDFIVVEVGRTYAQIDCERRDGFCDALLEQKIRCWQPGAYLDHSGDVVRNRVSVIPRDSAGTGEPREIKTVNIDRKTRLGIAEHCVDGLVVRIDRPIALGLIGAHDDPAVALRSGEE